jgi:hypothetical protein
VKPVPMPVDRSIAAADPDGAVTLVERCLDDR